MSDENPPLPTGYQLSALDPILRRELQDLVLSLDKTRLFVTHDLREALRLGERVVFLRDGRVAFAGDEAAMRRSEDEEVRAYFATLEG